MIVWEIRSNISSTSVKRMVQFGITDYSQWQSGFNQVCMPMSNAYTSQWPTKSGQKMYTKVVEWKKLKQPQLKMKIPSNLNIKLIPLNQNESYIIIY
jgi:hypothetical protein